MRQNVLGRVRRGSDLPGAARELDPQRIVARVADRSRRRLPRRLRKLALRKRLGKLSLVKTALVVRQRTGKSLLSQAREIVALLRGPGYLRPFDYYAYELFDDRRYSFAEKQEFVSWSYKVLMTKLNDPEWTAICDDKLVSYALFRGLGLPHPEVYAVYQPGGRTFGSVPCLRTPEEMAAFLRSGMRFPFFGKPVRDWRGGGASSVDRIDRDRDVLVLSGGEEIRVEDYVRRWPVACCAGQKRRTQRLPGYLLQERVVQHPLIERLAGGRVCTLRLVVLLGSDGPRLFRVSWKLPVGKNITDHVIDTSGNIKCSIDPATGRVERVLRGLGPQGTEINALGHYGTPIEVHPDTRERLTDVQLPEWNRTVALCLHAAAAIPGIRYQSWDIAMGPDGPLFLELNHHGGILQVPGCRGLNDPELRQFMASIASP
ncbi:MAG: hypothetical protein H0X65_05595 [Gemmatimonadetes bacterium]|jgi:hypothetical protein|nr:hypothetical protein [Gemmatimonadota bacterium]